MSNTDFLRNAEAELLPPGFQHGHIFKFEDGGQAYTVEVDGWHEAAQEAIEICQSDTGEFDSPKPGQKRKLANDVLKLVFLKELGLVKRGRIFLTSEEMYTWFHRTNSWLSAVCKHHDITVELRRHDRKRVRKRVRNVMLAARRSS
jgi:hypothetical protein